MDGMKEQMKKSGRNVSFGKKCEYKNEKWLKGLPKGRNLVERLSVSEGSNIYVREAVKSFLRDFKFLPDSQTKVLRQKKNEEKLYKYVQLMIKISDSLIDDQTSVFESLNKEAIFLRSQFPVEIKKILNSGTKGMIKKSNQLFYRKEVSPSLSNKIEIENISSEYGSQTLKSQDCIQDQGTSKDFGAKRKKTTSCDSKLLKNKKIKSSAFSSTTNQIQCKNKISTSKGHGPTKSSHCLSSPETVKLKKTSNLGWKTIEDDSGLRQFLNQSNLASPITTRTLNSINDNMFPRLS